VCCSHFIENNKKRSNRWIFTTRALKAVCFSVGISNGKSVPPCLGNAYDEKEDQRLSVPKIGGLFGISFRFRNARHFIVIFAALRRLTFIR